MAIVKASDISEYLISTDTEYFHDDQPFIGSTGDIISNYVSPTHSGQVSIDYWFECKDGFDSRYELPYSKGGKYVTRQDINNIAYIARRDFVNRSIGVKRGIQNGNWIGYPIGGFYKGAIVYDRWHWTYHESNTIWRKAKRYISKVNDNLEIVQTNPSKWKEYKDELVLNFVPRRTNFRCGTLPEWKPNVSGSPITGMKLMGRVDIPIDSFFQMLPSYTAWSNTSGGYQRTLEQTITGYISIKLSRYSDLERDTTHSSSYIEIGHWLENYRYDPEMPIPDSWFEPGLDASIIPLKAGTYWVYYDMIKCGFSGTIENDCTFGYATSQIKNVGCRI